MKFFRSKSLKQLGMYSLALMILVLVAEFFGIQYYIRALQEAERKVDFARGIQISTQQIALESQLFIHGNTDLASKISSQIEYQDHQLDVLAKGGRIDGTPFFIEPLSRLPKITFDNLQKRWQNYKDAISNVILNDNSVVAVQATDSLTESPLLPQATATSENVIHEARWLSLSDWFNKLITDLEEEGVKRQGALSACIVLFILFDIILLSLLLYGFNKFVIRPINDLGTNIINHTHTSDIAKNEIGQISHEVNVIIDHLKDATNFVTAIGEGKLDLDYKQAFDLQYSAGKNKLADSLILMQDKLKAMNDAERRRQWANEGLTKFVEIMRSSNDNLNTLGDAVISALVQYTNSKQGGLYILNDEDPHNKYLELISLFAFDTKKYEQQKIKLGEGILGQTFLEKETTHLTNMPDEYVRITSGLGDAAPKALLLFPLKVDKEAYGIIELASFQEYQQHEIEFVEKLGESIAATLASVRGAQKNRQLIEQFQQQTEEMRAQEEEMRQNMEEMQATQEEVARKEQAYVERIKELENKMKNSDSGESEIIRQRAQQQERQLRQKIEELTAQLSESRDESPEWRVAEEVEKTLKMNLEAIKITQEELNLKKGL
jgi:putative methionine-R-sulfoxide reductase with GAF domain